jgi:hypothetical protein
MAPPRNATKNGYGPRLYPWPPPPAEAELWVPSVTTVLGVVDKPAIANWKVDRAAKGAVAMAKSGALNALINQDEKMALSAIKTAWRSELDEAGQAGTLVHEYIEAQIKGTDKPELTPTAELIVRNLNNLMSEYEVEPIHSECTVYGLQPGLEWAGTLDLIVEMYVPGRGRKRLVADIKTSRGVYEDMAAQIGGAYVHADKLVTGDDGTVIDMPEVDGAVVFHVRPDSAFVVPVAADANALEWFMAARRLWAVKNNKEWRAVYAPLPAAQVRS